MILTIYLITFLMIGGLGLFAANRLRRGWSFRALFKEFNRKMWMTFTLGLVFFSLYGLLVYWGSSFARQWGTVLLFAARENPLFFIYGGLTLFAFLSLSIYFVRMLIKYLYLTRGRD